MSVFGTQVLAPADFGQVPLWRQIMRGFSQCCFQVNEATGLLFVLAVAWYDLRMAGFYVLGVVVGTLVAKFAGGIPDLLDLGLYGFNSGLMGLAMGTFFAYEPILWVWVAIMAAVVGIVAVAFSKVLPVPFLASPFILTFWVFYFCAGWVGLDIPPSAPFTDTDVHWIYATFVAAGGAVFANAVISGVIFLLGILVSNWRHAVIALVAVTIAHWIAFEGAVAPGLINAGLVGFNAILCSVAVYALVKEDLALALLGAIGATLWIRVFNDLDLIPLAAGFVIMTWVIIGLNLLTPRFRAEQDTLLEEEERAAVM